MERYAEPIFFALGIFPVLALLFTLPYMIYSYRKYGAVLMMRVVIMYAFIYYLLTVFCLAVLPFPQAGDVVRQKTQLNLIPFSYVPEIIDKGISFSLDQPSTWLNSLFTSGLYEPIFNILMFLPLGIFLRYYFGMGRLKTVLISLGLSFFLEITQLTACYGLAPFVYRCCDINDLIDNTLGGFLGYCVTPLLARLLPTRERLDQVSYQRGSRVSYVRRLVAFGVDFLAYGVLSILLALLLFPLGNLSNAVACLLAVILYQGILPWRWHGKTLGKAMVKIRLEDDRPGEQASLGAYMARALLLWGLLLNGYAILQPWVAWSALLSMMVTVLDAAGIAVLAVSVIICAIRNHDQVFYERWFHLRQASTVEHRERIEP